MTEVLAWSISVLAVVVVLVIVGSVGVGLYLGNRKAPHREGEGPEGPQDA